MCSVGGFITALTVANFPPLLELGVVSYNVVRYNQQNVCTADLHAVYWLTTSVPNFLNAQKIDIHEALTAKLFLQDVKKLVKIITESGVKPFTSFRNQKLLDEEYFQELHRSQQGDRGMFSLCVVRRLGKLRS
ncbi:beta subunit of fatty acid synthetase [Rhizina undulata]